MADEKQDVLTEGGDDEEIILVEDDDTPAEQPETPAAEEDEADDGDDGEDERLGADEDDDGLTPAQRKKRKAKARRDYARQMQERERAELQELRAFKSAAEQRLSAIESNSLGVNRSVIESRLQQAQGTYTQAEHIRKAAEEAGNVSDTLEAIRIRDAALAEMQQLSPALQQVDTMLQQQRAAPQAPQQSNVTMQFAQAWQEANPWYSDTGQDPQSALTRQIAQQLTAEGRTGSDLGYWRELTRRLGEATGASQQSQSPRSAARKSPPTGTRGESGALKGGSREVRLSSDRIQAIKDAGVWDDPVERNRMVKAYLDYDRQAKAG